MCGFVTDFISDVFETAVDIVEDVVDFVGDVVTGVVDTVVDVVDEVVSWVAPQPEVPEFSEEFEEQQAKGILINKFTANSSIPVVYGTRKVGGNVVFVETSGTDNQYLYMAVVLSEGEIDSVQTLFVNNNPVTLSGSLTDGTQRTVTSADSNFFDTENSKSLITVEAHLGTDTQTASPLLDELQSWTTDHRLRGLAYLALRFEWNADKFGGLPRVQATIKGRKVYNPNLDSTVTGGSGSHRKDTSSTWAYSDNPILQMLDYLRNERFGMGIANSYFDSNFADWQTATDVCDADITPFSGASAIDLLDSHIVVDTSRKAINNVKEFVKGSRSYLNFSGGKYNVLVETTGTASITLTEDNIIGGITVQSKNKNSRYNRVVVTFVNPDKNFQTDTVQFPPVDETGLASSDQHATMKAEDGDLLLEGRFDYTMLTNPHQAQEMAEIILRRSRSSLDISLRADATALDLAVGDIVNVTHATPAFSAKPFRVQRISINADHTVSIQCSEHQDSFYAFGLQLAPPEIPDTTLPNPFNVQAPAITVTDELRVLNEEAISVLVVEATTADLFATDFEVQAKKSTDTNFINLGKASGRRFELINVEDDAIYNVRARTVSSISRSVFTTATHQIVGKTAPPETVTNFSINIIQTEAHLSWTPVGDLDLSHYRIRHSRDTTASATYANSVDLIAKVSRPANTAVVPAMTGTYFIKAVDKLGNESLDSTSSVAIIQNIKDLNLVSTSTQNPTFSGAKSNVVLVDSNLRLSTSVLFDSGAGNFDTTGGLFDGGGGKVSASGTYDFDNPIDVGGVFTSRVTANITMTRLDFGVRFDDATGNFDDREGLFDGDANEFGDTNCELQIATTEDDPASGSATFTAFRKFFVGDYKARGFKFRALLTSTDSDATPSVSALSVTVDMPDRIIAENDIASGTGTKAITFSPSFKSLQGVGISAQNLASGDFYAITNKSATGFTIQFFNSGGSGINRTFDYVAKGFGELVT
tara:strand:+ start:164 stop:3127 length:2964 start_codon:yes stop_codon:yes gene_type:complete